MSVIDRYAGLIVDIDGVVVRGEEPIQGVAGFLRALRRQGKPIVFVTNNSTRSAAEWGELFRRHDLDAEPHQVVSSAVATAELLSSSQPRCLVIGEHGLFAALEDARIDVVDAPDDADTVVVGWDKQLTYDKLRAAATAISRGCRFVGTNPDTVYPAGEGLWPGNGAALAYLRAATGVAPEVVGKPRTPLLEIAAGRLGVDSPVLVVGDQLSTDITAAENMGWDSALVLSGVDSWESLEGASAVPTWVVPTISDLDGPEGEVLRYA